MNKKIFAVLTAIVATMATVYVFRSGSPTQPNQKSGTIRVVAAENFFGSFVKEIGGSHVQVLSIVSDPNADPHEYESSSNNARAIATADYVIENGAGYDGWADKLLSGTGPRGA